MFFLDADGRALPGPDEGARLFRWSGTFDWRSDRATVRVPTAAVRWVGVALVVWAVDAALLARASRRVLRRTALAAGVANLAWEVATVVLVALGAFSVVGAGLALAVAAVVGGLGVLQLRALRR